MYNTSYGYHDTEGIARGGGDGAGNFQKDMEKLWLGSAIIYELSALSDFQI